MSKSLAWVPLVAALGALLTTGCSHDIQSPTPLGHNASPDLVCTDKPVIKPFNVVSINGVGMTPMPSKTLEDKRELILPTISLQVVQPLGATKADETVVIHDEAAHPEHLPARRPNRRAEQREQDDRAGDLVKAPSGGAMMRRLVLASLGLAGCLCSSAAPDN